MSQELNSIIDQLANIDSASAKIMQKTQDEKAKYADYISKEKQAFDQNLEDQVNAQVNEYEKTLAKECEKEISAATSSKTEVAASTPAATLNLPS